MRKLMLVCLLLCPMVLLAQGARFSSLEERMTASEFRQAGLEKLSESELRALNAWLDRNIRLADPAIAQAVAEGRTTVVDAATAAADDRVGFDGGPRVDVVSYIEGKFTGWTGRTRFKLANGQVWQQVDGEAANLNLESPRVTITPGLIGSWRLRIEGSNRSTAVKRIQ